MPLSEKPAWDSPPLLICVTRTGWRGLGLAVGGHCSHLLATVSWKQEGRGLFLQPFASRLAMCRQGRGVLGESRMLLRVPHPSLVPDCRLTWVVPSHLKAPSLLLGCLAPGFWIQNYVVPLHALCDEQVILRSVGARHLAPMPLSDVGTSV